MEMKSSIYIFVFLLLVSSANALLTDDLLAYYKLNENSGTTVFDAHGSNHGTYYNAPTSSTGVIDKSMFFNGLNEYAALSVDTLMSTADGVFSVAFWIKTSETSNMIPFGSVNDGGTTAFILEINDQTDGDYRFFFRDEDGHDSRGEFELAGINDGEWHYTVIIFDTPNTYCYVDDVLVSIVSDSTSNPDNFAAFDYDFLIGAYNNRGSVASYTEIYLSDVAFWTRALTSSEVSELYNSGNGLDYPFSDGWTNTPPSITINSPVDNYHTNDVTPSFNITITDVDGNTSDCTLRVNGSITATSSNVASGSTVILTSTSLSEDVHTWTITCDDADATVTTNRTIIIDTTNPIFTLNSIESDNSTRIIREENVTYWFNDSWSDTYMYAYEHYLYDPTGTQMKAWNETALTSSFVWTNSSYDFTNAALGTWNYSVTGSDDHTARIWNPDDVIITNQYIRFYKDDAWVQIENEQGNLRSIEYNCDDYEDRCGFSFEPNNNRREWHFRLSSSQRLDYRGELYEYPTFVAAPMWVDFITNSPRVQSMSVTPDDDDMIITVTMDRNNKERIVFESIGGLNIVSKNYSFDVVGNNPPNVTLAFTVDPVFETQNEVASVYYTDAENHTGFINWYWYINAISVFNETTNNVLNASTSYSTLLAGNYSSADTISITTIVNDGYNTTSVSDDISVSSSSTGGGPPLIIVMKRNCLFLC